MLLIIRDKRLYGALEFVSDSLEVFAHQTTSSGSEVKMGINQSRGGMYHKKNKVTV